MLNIRKLTWKEFQTDALQFLELAKKLNDDWTWETKNEYDVHSYLCYNQKTLDKKSQQIIQIEYHVVYSISYQVPILYLQAYSNNGKILSLEEAWNIFNFSTGDEVGKIFKERMLSTLTQMEHPILLKPYLCLHPCRTAELLGQMPNSCNRILTFISLIGPYVLLNLNSSYGIEAEKLPQNTNQIC